MAQLFQWLAGFRSQALQQGSENSMCDLQRLFENPNMVDGVDALMRALASLFRAP